MFRTEMLLPAGLALGLGLTFSFPLRAQTTIEVDTITCQFLSFRVADPVQIAIWLSGYYHGLKHDPKLEVQKLQANYGRLKSECFSKQNAILMDVIKKLE
jgi:hypothetical protein